MRARITIGPAEVPEPVRKLNERVLRVLDAVLQDLEGRLERGEKIDIAPHRAMALAIRFAEMTMDLPPPRRDEPKFNLRNLTVEQLREFRRLLELVERPEDETPKLPT